MAQRQDVGEKTVMNTTTDELNRTIHLIDPPTSIYYLRIFGVTLYHHYQHDTGHGPIAGLRETINWVQRNMDVQDTTKKVESYIGQYCTVYRRGDVESPEVRSSVPEHIATDDESTGFNHAGYLIHQMENELSVENGRIDATPIREQHYETHSSGLDEYIRRALARWTWIVVPNDYTPPENDYSQLYADLYELYVGQKDDVLQTVKDAIDTPPHVSIPDDEAITSEVPLSVSGVPFDETELTPEHVERMDDPYATFFFSAGINYMLRQLRSDVTDAGLNIQNISDT